MAEATSIVIERGQFLTLFAALKLLDKIKRGTLSSVVVTNSPSKQYPGATSEMLTHYNAAGAHACTTHRIIDPNGLSLYWAGSDVKAGVVTIAKGVAPRQVGRAG